MDPETAFAAAATLLSGAFAATTFERWRGSRSRHELAWTVALVMFSGAAAALWWGAAMGWSGPAFRTFFLLGAITNVPVLALGTVYLLTPNHRVVADRVAIATAAVLLFATGVLVAAPLTAPIPVEELPRGSDVFGWLPRLLAALASSLGALVLFGGAAWSIVRATRVPGGRRRAVANVFIATGTLILSLGGLFNSVAGEMTAFGLSLVLGAAALFVGFLIATSGRPPRPATDPVTERLDAWLGPPGPPSTSPASTHTDGAGHVVSRGRGTQREAGSVVTGSMSTGSPAPGSTAPGSVIPGETAAGSTGSDRLRRTFAANQASGRAISSGRTNER